MIFHHLHIDASYNTQCKARSRSDGHLFVGTHTSPMPVVCNNEALLNSSTIMCNVMSSIAKAESSTLLNNLKEAVALRNTLIETGHLQPRTPVEVDNTTATGFANRQIKEKQSKLMEMRFYWIQDRVAQKQFLVSWRPGSTNLADYFTKDQLPFHHQAIARSPGCFKGRMPAIQGKVHIVLEKQWKKKGVICLCLPKSISLATTTTTITTTTTTTNRERSVIHQIERRKGS